MFGTTLIGICFSATSLGLVVFESSWRGVRFCDAQVLKLPEGSIDGSTGALCETSELRKLIQKALQLPGKRLSRWCVYLGVPSVATHVEALSSADAVSHGDIRQEVGSTVSGERSNVLTAVAASDDKSNGRMLVAARRDTIISYINLLGDLRHSIVNISPASVARYNLCRFMGPEPRDRPCVVASAGDGVVEVACWSRGVMAESERIVVDLESCEVPSRFMELLGLWRAQRNVAMFFMTGDLVRRQCLLAELYTAGISACCFDAGSLSPCRTSNVQKSDESRCTLLSGRCDDAVSLLIGHFPTQYSQGANDRAQSYTV